MTNKQRYEIAEELFQKISFIDYFDEDGVQEDALREDIVDYVIQKIEENKYAMHKYCDGCMYKDADPFHCKCDYCSRNYDDEFAKEKNNSN